MNDIILQIDFTGAEHDINEEDLIEIRLRSGYIAKVLFSKLVSQSKYIRDNYKYSEALNSIQTDIEYISERMKIDDESIKLFIGLIQDEKINIPIEHYKNFYKLSEYFKIQKYTQELDAIREQELCKNLNFTIQNLLDSSSTEDEFETTLASNLEKFLANRINECFENPKFGELPISLIYRIIEKCDKEKISQKLLIDFIFKSIDTRFILFKFVEFQKLTNDRIEYFFNFFEEQQKYLEYLPFNLLFMKQIINDNHKLTEELSQTKSEYENVKQELDQEKENHIKTKQELSQEKENHIKTKQELSQTKDEYENLKQELDQEKKVKDELNQIKNEMNKHKPIILVSGINNYNQISENSNNATKKGTSLISPPFVKSFNQFSLLSYSIYNRHSVLTTSSGSMYGTGRNSDGRISSSLIKADNNQLAKFSIKDDNGQQLSPVSAVCIERGTLYMFSKSNGSGNQLVYCDIEINGGNPIFLDIGNRQPIALFGGCFYAAAISSEGEVILINRNSIRDSPESMISANSLPDGEKASSVAFDGESVVVLSSNCRVYSSVINEENSLLRFTTVDELAGDEIVCVSGTSHHFFAVNKEGRVFGRGSNECGQLGLGKEIKSVSLFTEISSLEGQEIRATYAGVSHSLFETREGKILSCGSNRYGELLLSRGPSEEKVYSPTETTITGGATFCIAGEYHSTVFAGIDPPPNTPNIRLQ